MSNVVSRTLTFTVLVALPAFAATPSGSRCPQGAELREKALKTQGSYGDLRWISLAIPETASAKDSYCYERTVVVANPTPVNWPVAGIDNLFVKKEFTTSTCCIGGARIEDGPLEFGAFPRKIGTLVYRGKGEAKTNVAWNAAIGEVIVSGEPVLINLRADRGREGTITISNNGNVTQRVVLEEVPTERDPWIILRKETDIEIENTSYVNFITIQNVGEPKVKPASSLTFRFWF